MQRLPVGLALLLGAFWLRSPSSSSWWERPRCLQELITIRQCLLYRLTSASCLPSPSHGKSVFRETRCRKGWGRLLYDIWKGSYLLFDKSGQGGSKDETKEMLKGYVVIDTPYHQKHQNVKTHEILMRQLFFLSSPEDMLIDLRER